MTFPAAELRRREDFVILLNGRIAHPGDVRLMGNSDGSSGSNLPLTAGRQQHLYKRRAKRGASREGEKGEEKERGVSAHEGDDGGQDAEGGKICAS